MAKTVPNDPFSDEDWGPTEETFAASDEMPPPKVDTTRLEYIKPHHVKTQQGYLELVSASNNSKLTEAVLTVKFEGKLYNLGLRDFDKGYIACAKKFGSKKTDWHGKLMFRVVVTARYPKGYIAIRPV